MDTEKETDASVEESDEWFYNYFGRDNVAKIKEEAKEEGREEGRAEGREEGRAEGREEGRAEGREEEREEGREEERRKNILNMLRMRYSVTCIGKALQIPDDDIIKVAMENNISISD